MRTCNVCKISKDISSFHKNAVIRGEQRYKFQCRECRTKNQNNYRKRSSVRKEQWIRWKEKKSPLVIKAHTKVRYHLAKGNIIKLYCEVCGSKKSVAHHDDYNYPLSIRWLCNLHHVEWHKNNKAIGG